MDSVRDTAGVPSNVRSALRECIDVCRRDSWLVDEADAYMHGDHPQPYIPDNADAEFRSLAKKSIMNLFPLVINSVAESCHVENIRHSSVAALADVFEDGGTGDDIAPEMNVWQRNHMDSRQLSVTRTLAAHGIVYGLTMRDADTGEVRLDFFPADRAASLYSDPINDTVPKWGFVIRSGTVGNIRLAYLFDATSYWRVEPGDRDYRITPMGEHGLGKCPVVRAHLYMGLDGVPHGFVRPAINAAQQVNQTSFDLLAAQSWGSFKVRAISGMAPPVRRWSATAIEAAYPRPEPSDPDFEELEAQWLRTPKPAVGDPILDENGQEIPIPIHMNQKRFLIADDPDTKFQTLDETNIAPLITALDSRVRQFMAQTQTPLTYLMGEMANLSAEALQTAEIAKTRRDGMVRIVLGELYENMLRNAMTLMGEDARASDEGTEVVWADASPTSLSAAADALGKMGEMLDIPRTALWAEVPGMTGAKLRQWMKMRENEAPEGDLAARLRDHDALTGMERMVAGAVGSDAAGFGRTAS